MRLGKKSPLEISTGAPQGCLPSLLIFSFYTNDCTSTASSKMGLFINRRLNSWCSGVQSHKKLWRWWRLLETPVKAAPMYNTRKKKSKPYVLLQRLRKHGPPRELLIQSCTADIESVLCTDRLQGTMRTAGKKILGHSCPSSRTCALRTRKWAGKITPDPSHPEHDLLALSLQTDLLETSLNFRGWWVILAVGHLFYGWILWL